MKYKVSLLSSALLLASNSWASDQPYYTIEEFNAVAEGAEYGAYPSAISEDGAFIGTYSLRAALSKEIDIGLPYTFNRECQFDRIICQLEFEGSESSSDLSYDNAYKKWRNAQSDISLGFSDSYVSYFMGNGLVCSTESSLDEILDCASDEPQIYDDTTDVKVTDVNNANGNSSFVIGYSSAPYINGVREYTRRAFIKYSSDNIADGVQLLPEFTSNGGFTSAYKMQVVGDRTLVVGSSSVSYPRNNDNYFRDCFFTEEYDYRSTYNELVRCPGFDTQAWVWDVTDAVAGDEIEGSRLATQWLDGNSTNKNDLTWSANAFDINTSGIAVGTSTFERNNNAEGGRQRAIIMQPDATGIYSVPLEITAATTGIDDQDDNIYNTWAVAISDQNLIIGNREYAAVKDRNKPTEFFTYAFDPASKQGSVKFPLLDKKVLTTQDRLDGDSNVKQGANSEAFDVNKDGVVVGKADDYDQNFPVYDGKPRSQTGFVYDSASDQSWRLNDLICSRVDGVVESPYYRIRSARVINDAGIILAEGFSYKTVNDYRLKINATETSFKLTPNTEFTGQTPIDSPNCWELFEEAEPYERQGAASFWLWIFTLPLILLRRRSVKHR
jgi:hypothetical protein